MSDRVLAALGRLSDREREALQLVLWEELSHADAAQVLGCSANAAAIRVHRAKARLRGELSATEPSPTDRAATGRAATGRAATGRAATGRAATGRAATERSGTERAGTERAGTERPGTGMSDPQSVPAITPARTWMNRS
jgi:hypothetical protein